MRERARGCCSGRLAVARGLKRVAVSLVRKLTGHEEGERSGRCCRKAHLEALREALECRVVEREDVVAQAIERFSIMVFVDAISSFGQTQPRRALYLERRVRLQPSRGERVAVEGLVVGRSMKPRVSTAEPDDRRRAGELGVDDLDCFPGPIGLDNVEQEPEQQVVLVGDHHGQWRTD